MIHRYLLQFITLTLALVLITACATNIAGRKQIVLISENEAIEASAQAYQQTLKPYAESDKLDNQANVVSRVNRITDKLVEQAVIMRPDTKDWQWQVKVLDDPETVNAWCMAGGKMAIYTGLINKLNATDDEIAQVMGHEISHALANHSVERMSVAMASNVVVEVVNASTGNQGGSLASVAAQVALTLPNSRTSESEADEIGIELAARAGFDPNAAVSLWQKMAQVGGSGGPEFLSTHPAPKNRQKALNKLIPKMMPYYEAAR
jgi:predicted Zn-dependent protease